MPTRHGGASETTSETPLELTANNNIAIRINAMNLKN
jgi:hypothetical protein